MTELHGSHAQCPHCRTGLGYEAVSLCLNCDRVFHRGDDGPACIDLHFPDCPGARRKDEEKLAAWVAASGRDA